MQKLPWSLVADGYLEGFCGATSLGFAIDTNTATYLVFTIMKWVEINL